MEVVLGIKTSPEIDEKIKQFAKELVGIFLKKDATFQDKLQMLIVHVSENKVWAVYFIVMLFGTCMLLIAVIQLLIFEMM